MALTEKEQEEAREEDVKVVREKRRLNGGGE